MVCSVYLFCFFKQKTAYEMRISDWSSDVCSSDLCTRGPSADAPMSCSPGADTAMVMPCVDASTLATPEGSTPPTGRTPGIVAGAPTRVVPLPRLPAATTMTTSWSKAYRKASSHDGSHSGVFVVSDMLMTCALLSTAQRTASALCSLTGTVRPELSMDTDRSSASGATPIIPRPPTRKTVVSEQRVSLRLLLRGSR